MINRAALLNSLTHDIRVISADQIAVLFNATKQAVRQFVHRLESADLVERRVVMVAPPLELRESIHAHLPGMEPPHFGRLAHLVQSRGDKRTTRTVLVSATERAATITGGPLPARRATRATELWHDITLTQIYLSHFQGRDNVTWMPEDALLAAGRFRYDGLVPDAVIQSLRGETILELAGRSYRASRLAEFHFAFADRGYQLW